MIKIVRLAITILIIVLLFLVVADFLNPFGSCMHCHRHWDKVQGYTIPYSEYRGMFPLCNRCYEKLPYEKICVYIQDLLDRWGEQDETIYMNGTLIQPNMTNEEIYINASDFVKKEKLL